MKMVFILCLKFWVGSVIAISPIILCIHLAVVCMHSCGLYISYICGVNTIKQMQSNIGKIESFYIYCMHTLIKQLYGMARSMNP